MLNSRCSRKAPSNLGVTNLRGRLLGQENMSTITQLDVSYSRKVQLEQFEPIEHSVSLEVIVGEDEDPDDVYDEHVAAAEDMVERAIAERVAAKKLESDDGDE